MIRILSLAPQKLTWTLKMMVSKFGISFPRGFHFQVAAISFRGCQQFLFFVGSLSVLQRPTPRNQNASPSNKKKHKIPPFTCATPGAFGKTIWNLSTHLGTKVPIKVKPPCKMCILPAPIPSREFHKYTLPDTNIAPENRQSQKEMSIPTIHFQVRAVSFRKGSL